MTLSGLAFSAASFFHYWLKKEDKYSLQSPFVFSVYEGLIKFLESRPKGDPEIENFRNSLLENSSEITVEDLGAGSKKVPYSRRQIRKITRYSTSSPKYCQLYQYFCQLTRGENVLELGTCTGVSTRYLSKATKGKLWTLEGSKEIQQVAQRSPLPVNTEFVLGNITTTLPELLKGIDPLDFVLIDANHTYEGTINSFIQCQNKIHPRGIIAIGDIHWSSEMSRAWQEIKANPKVRLTIDFFECGILFFDYPGPKTDLILAI